MATATDIERLHYYQGEYLGALDFEAQQAYHRDMRRRHNIGHHTTGIVVGLELAQIPNGKPQNEVDIYVQPGMAVDGFGREIFVLGPYKLDALLFQDFTNTLPQNLEVWISYDETLTGRPAAGYEICDPATQFGRVQENYKIVIQPALPTHDPVVVDGQQVFPPAPPPAPPPPAGQLTIPLDQSVPYQEFPDDEADPRPLWLVQLGMVKWDYQNNRFLQLADNVLTNGRLYVGAIAAAVIAPAAALLIKDRASPDPLPTDSTDPKYGGVAAEIEGSLQVDRLLTAVQQVLIEGTADPAVTNPPSPLTIRGNGTGEELIQFQNPAAQPRWHISQNLNGNTPGINIGEITGTGTNEARLFIQATLTGQVASDRNVGIGTTTPRNPLAIRGRGPWEEIMSFEDTGGTTRWHLNQNPQGKTPQGLAFTRGLNFCETIASADFRLFLQEGGNVGVGTPLPQQNLSVNHAMNIDQANANDGQINPGLSFGDSSGEGIASKRSVGGNQYGLDFYTDFAVRMSITNGGKIGIGTMPDSQLHLGGGQWDLTNTEGDLKIGNAAMRLKIGVALGGAGAGDARIRAVGGTDRLMLGTGISDVVTLSGVNVGIGTITPATALDVSGDVHVSGSLKVDNNANLANNVTIGGNLNVTGSGSFGAGKGGYVTEHFIYKSGQPLERGDVIVLSGSPTSVHYGADKRIPVFEVDLTDKGLDPRVVGVVDEVSVEGNPPPNLDSASVGNSQVGIVVTLGAYAHCKVDADITAIAVGDLLTTSPTRGHAQKLLYSGAQSSGAILGKALAPLSKGKGKIPVLVMQH